MKEARIWSYFVLRGLDLRKAKEFLCLVSEFPGAPRDWGSPVLGVIAREYRRRCLSLFLCVCLQLRPCPRGSLWLFFRKCVTSARASILYIAILCVVLEVVDDVFLVIIELVINFTVLISLIYRATGSSLRALRRGRNSAALIKCLFE